MNKDYVTIGKQDIKNLATKGINNLNTIALYCKIRSMAEETGSCKASNAYFADFFNISERQISRNLTTLVDAQLITVSLERQGKRVINRDIRLLDIHDDIHVDIHDDIHDDNMSTSMSSSMSSKDIHVDMDVFDDHECLGSNNMSFGASHQGDKKETKETNNNKKTEFIDFSLLKTFEYPYSEDKELKQKRRETAYKLVTTSSITPSSSYEDKRNYYFAKNIIAYPYEPELPFKEQRADELAKGIRKWSDKDEKMFKEGMKEMERK